MSESKAQQFFTDDSGVPSGPARAEGEVHESDATTRMLSVQRDEACQRAADLGTRVEALTVQLETQRLVAANAARERDACGIRLIDAEQRAAGLSRKPGAMGAEALQQRVAELEDELAVIRRTVSRRLIERLRRARKALSSRIG